MAAQPWFKVSDEGLQSEGPSFDRAGNLLFVEVFSGREFRLTPDRTPSTIVGENKRGSAGLAIHKEAIRTSGMPATDEEVQQSASRVGQAITA